MLVRRRIRTVFGDALEVVLLGGNEPAHVATDEEQIGQTTENSQWRFPLERVSHDRRSVGEFEFVHVPEPFERSLDHFIDEPVWPIERRNPRDESLRDPKVAALEGDNVADFKQPLCPARAQRRAPRRMPQTRRERSRPAPDQSRVRSVRGFEFR
jgi:hypothetical protein